MLDVTRYARLWHAVWWTQHLVTVLALCVGLTLLGLTALKLTGQLEPLGDWLVAEVRGRSDMSAADRRQALMNIAAIYWLARGMFDDGGTAPVLVMAISGALVGTYVLSCGTFRLRLVTVGLIALAADVIIVGTRFAQLLGDGVFAATYAPAGGPVQKLAEAALATICFVILVFYLILLIVQGVLAFRLWRHRLGFNLPPTWRMTRPLGIRIGAPRLRLPVVSALGLTIHLGVLVALAAAFAMFPLWIVQAVMFSPIFLVMLVAWIVFTPLGMLYRAVTGEVVVRSSDFADVVNMWQVPARLVVIAVVVVAAHAIWRLGTRFNLRYRDQVILKDKPPALLLRSFADDVAGIPPNALIPRLFWRRKRLEETVARELTHEGPFEAIGKPGERLPQIGARRLYVPDADWQEVVRSYIARSRPIILIAGKTTWVQWELSTVVALERLADLLIVFARTTDTERAERWRNLTPAFEGTAWSHAADEIDIADVLAVVLTNDGIVAIKSQRSHESDYQAALRIAVYLMARGATPLRK